MTGKLIAFPLDTSETTSHRRSETEAPMITRARPARASLASELRPLRRARTERDDGALGELAASETTVCGPVVARPGPSNARTAGDGHVASGEIDTAARRDPPTMGERLRAGSARATDPLRELIGEAAPLERDARSAKRPAIRVLVGGRVKYVGWV